ncbi:MAG: NAD(P)H-hydrate dehydratase [Thermoplasmata archaeon]|nr:NAD(P)H-hydrate dehydratase [Thermoplasmata archaeon]
MVKAAIPPEEVKVLDINAAYHGVRTITLMERAGEAVARYIIENYPTNSRIAIICGKGNNGGDGFVASRHLLKSMRPDVFLVESEQEITTDLARSNLHLVRGVARPIKFMDIRQYDIIIDSMLGVGIKGRPREPYASIIRSLNRTKKPRIAVDVPSGWPSNFAVRADTTITFHAPKTGMTKRNCGKIVVADIGIPPEAEMYCGPGEYALLPPRRRDSHKGDSGRVLVIGGGPYSGAPAFAGMAAMRSGIDLIFVATPEPAAIPVSIYSPNLIVRPLKGMVLGSEHVEELLKMSAEFDVVVIGPGLGDSKPTMIAIQRFISKCRKPMVIDADAIAACGAKPHILKGKSGVITPHAGEFKKLTRKTVPQDDYERRAQMVREAAAKLRMTVVLKGPRDVVSDGRYVKLNRTGNDGMTVGGTGDVLTGLIAGIMAQKATPYAAGRIGVFTAGLAGDLAFEEKSYGLLATDVIDKIPIVLRRYLMVIGS